MAESDIEDAVEQGGADGELAEGAVGEAPAREPLPLGPGREPTWSQVWQLPVLVLGLGLLILGVSLSLPSYDGPDFPGAMDSTAAMLDAGQLDDAAAKIDAIAAEPEFLQGDKTPELHGRFEQLRSDWLYLDIHRRPYIDPEVEEVASALDRVAQGYKASQDLGHFLPARSLRRYAETLAWLGRDEQALEIIHQLPAQAQDERVSMLRGLIERFADRPADSEDRAITELIRDFETEVAGVTDRNRRTTHEVWAAELRARRLIQAEAPDAAADLLSRRIPVLGARLPDPTDETALAPLYVALADAHRKAGRAGDAGIYYRRADALVEPSDTLRARILVGLGRVETLERGLADVGGRDRAEGFYNIALRDFPAAPQA
ncbi:MAG: hypothetical protein AAGA57_06720, partial [Planctomycetota bacterium]